METACNTISGMIYWALLTSLTRICVPVSTWIYDICLIACCKLSLSLKYLGQAIVKKTKGKTKIEVIVFEWGMEFRAKICLQRVSVAILIPSFLYWKDFCTLVQQTLISRLAKGNLCRRGGCLSSRTVFSQTLELAGPSEIMQYPLLT